MHDLSIVEDMESELIRTILRGPCEVTNAEHRYFASNHKTPDEVIVSHRFMQVVNGRLLYEVEGRCKQFDEGAVLWAPAWCRRSWKVPHRGFCELLWCQFSIDTVAIEPYLYEASVKSISDIHLLKKIVSLWPARDAGAELLFEAWVKTLAAEFWSAAKAKNKFQNRLDERHAEVRRALNWIEANYMHADALEKFYQKLCYSPNHFRLLFKEQTGDSVQARIMRLRMRRARYLLVEGTLSIKEIAASSGYNDALYFSKKYRQFWGRTPSEDRRSKVVA